MIAKFKAFIASLSIVRDYGVVRIGRYIKDLPSKEFPFYSLSFLCPYIERNNDGTNKSLTLNANTEIGYSHSDDHLSLVFVILGFGVTYCKQTGF